MLPSDSKAGWSYSVQNFLRAKWYSITYIWWQIFILVHSFCPRYVLRALCEVWKLQQQWLHLQCGGSGWILLRPWLHAGARLCGDWVRGCTKPTVEWDRASLSGWVNRFHPLAYNCELLNLFKDVLPQEQNLKADMTDLQTQDFHCLLDQGKSRRSLFTRIFKITRA